MRNCLDVSAVRFRTCTWEAFPKQAPPPYIFIARSTSVRTATPDGPLGM